MESDLSGKINSIISVQEGLSLFGINDRRKQNEKKVNKVLKRAMAVVAMAAAVAVTVPSLAMAGTAPDKGCTGNTSTGYHNYRFYCIGFKSKETLNHRYLTLDGWKTCMYEIAEHGSRERCEYCGKNTWVTGTHCDNEFHDCSIGTVDHGYCNGLGSDVTFVTY